MCACNITGFSYHTATAQQSEREGRFQSDALPDHKDLKSSHVETFIRALKIKCKRGEEVPYTKP